MKTLGLVVFAMLATAQTASAHAVFGVTGFNGGLLHSVVVPSHLMDSKRHDFKGIRATGIADTDGDKAFDAEEFMAPASLSWPVTGIHPPIRGKPLSSPSTFD